MQVPAANSAQGVFLAADRDGLHWFARTHRRVARAHAESVEEDRIIAGQHEMTKLLLVEGLNFPIPLAMVDSPRIERNAMETTALSLDSFALCRDEF